MLCIYAGDFVDFTETWSMGGQSTLQAYTDMGNVDTVGVNNSCKDVTPNYEFDVKENRDVLFICSNQYIIDISAMTYKTRSIN